MKVDNFPYHIIGTVGSDEAQTMNDGQLQAENKRRAENTDENGNAAPLPVLVPSRTQTFIINEFETVDEFVTHPAPDEVKLDIINRAVRLKQQVAAKRLIEDPQFELVDGAYNMFDSISEVVERRKMTDEDKAIKALDKLPEEIRVALLQKLLAGQSAEASA